MDDTTHQPGGDETVKTSRHGVFRHPERAGQVTHADTRSQLTGPGVLVGGEHQLLEDEPGKRAERTAQWRGLRTDDERARAGGQALGRELGGPELPGQSVDRFLGHPQASPQADDRKTVLATRGQPPARQFIGRGAADPQHSRGLLNGQETRSPLPWFARSFGRSHWALL